METSTDTSLADTIVADVVTERQREGHGETVEQFGESVQKEVNDRTEILRGEFGEAVDGIAGDAMEKSVSYAEARNDLLDPQAKVDNTEKIGAAGFNDKADNSVTYSMTTMDYRLENPDYWGRVAEHEQIHQEDQADTFNQDSVTYVGKDDAIKTIQVHSTLMEWQPSKEANKPEDLTPEYQSHVDEGEEFVNAIGPDGDRLAKEALKTGDIQSLQQQIIEKQREEILDNLLSDQSVTSAR